MSRIVQVLDRNQEKWSDWFVQFLYQECGRLSQQQVHVAAVASFVWGSTTFINARLEALHARLYTLSSNSVEVEFENESDYFVALLRYYKGQQ